MISAHNVLHVTTTSMSMAIAEKNHTFINSPSYSTITEKEPEGQEEYEEPAATSGCFCFGFGRRSDQEIRYLLHHHHQTQRSERRESWVVENFKKLKEFSEVIAGPKWKNFVRKVGKYCNPRKQRTAAAAGTNTTTNWMYSPNSYAMNFDHGNDYEDEDYNFCSFSSRFSVAVPPPSSDQNKDDRVFNYDSDAPMVKAVVL